nr:hypothetical protein [Pseudoclavibacter sp. AY1F1]
MFYDPRECGLESLKINVRICVLDASVLTYGFDERDPWYMVESVIEKVRLV